MTDDELNDALLTVCNAMKDHPALGPLMQDKFDNLNNEQRRRSTVVVGTQALPDQAVPLGAAQLPAAAPILHPPAAQSPPVRLRAAELSVEAKERWLDKMRTRIKRVHAKLVAAVYKNIAPDDVINHVLDAICNQEGRGAGLPAKFNHLVLINGHVQRGKTCIKALEAAAVWEIFKDDEVIDKPFSIIITPMVPWAKQLANGFQKLTGAANIVTDPASEPSVQNAGADDSDDSDAENDPTEVENPFAGGMPQCMLSTIADLNDAMDQVADKGGAVIISRSKGALEKAIQLVYLLNKRALGVEGDKVVRSPLIALDEVDKMVGSCASARGSKRPDPTGKVPTIYENLVNLMCGFADLPKGQEGVVTCYDTLSFDALKVNSPSSRRKTAVLRTNRNIPFLVSAVSATNGGYCAWTLSRVGVPHANPKVERDLLSLLDIVSFNEPSEDEYRGANQAVKFGDMVLDDKEISTQNKWCCEKTLAIESAAAQTPGSCLMVCTTTTVNEGTVRGLSMQRVHHEHLVRTEIGRRMAAMACGVQIGYDEGGQFQIFMHGGNKAFKGMLGIGYSSPSDPFGVAKLKQLEALCAHHKTETHARIVALEEQLRLEGDDLSADDQAIVEQQKDSAERLDAQLGTSVIAFRDRASRTAAKAPGYTRRLDRVIAALQKADAAERIYARAETASESGVPGAPGTPTPDQLQKLYESKSALRSDATERTEKLINLRHQIATDRTDSDTGEQFSTCLFGQAELLPLLYIWERELKARKPSYLPLAPSMDGGSRKKNDLNTAHVSMLLGFVRSLDCSFMLGALPPQLQAQTEAARSKNVPIKVVGMGCIRRSMHVIGYYIDTEGNDLVTSTLTHVLQYSNHDGASQEQQIKRFATTAVQHNKGVPIQVLTSARGWLAMKGHVAYNDMPEWRRPEAERRAWAKRFTELARRKLALEPLADEHIEQVNSILSREIKIQKNKEGIRPDSDMKRTMRIMMETMTIPLAFARMCMYLPSPLFASTSGREYGALFVRAREAQRIVDPTRNNADDDDQDLANPAPPPKKNRVVGENVIHAWIRKVLVALVAFGDEATNDVASAVGHGVIWTHLKQMFRHVWDDPDENARLLAAHKSAWDILNPDNNEGGLGHYLGDMVKKGAIFRVEQGDPRMSKEKRKNLAWYLKRGSVALGDEPGPSVAQSEAGPSSSAAATPLPTEAWAEAQVWANHEAFAMEVEARVAGASNDDAFEHDSDSDDVARHPQPGAKRSRAAPKRLTANRLGGPSTIPYSHTGAAKRQRADEAASSDDASSEAPKFEDDSGDESANVSDSDDEDSGDDYVEGASDDEGVSDDDDEE